MSVIVAIKENGVVYLGCDSQVTLGGTRTTLKNPNNYKIWKVNNTENCLMGSVGNLRDACVIRTLDDLVSDYNVYRHHVGYDFVVNKIVPDIIDRLKESHYLPKDGVFEGMESSYLFCYQDLLFNIGSDGSVIEVEDYVAIGSGSPEAIGSLLSTEKENPIERIIKAIKASAAHDIYVNYPIVISNTANTEFTIITKENEDSYISKEGKKNRTANSNTDEVSSKTRHLKHQPASEVSA